MENENINLGAEVGNDDNQQTNQGKLFTETEMEKLLISESDKRVEQALKSFKEKELPKQIEKAREEATKLAKMSQEQQAKFAYEQAEQTLKERELSLLQKELRIEAHELLSNKKLPVELLDSLNYNNVESLVTSIDKVEHAFKNAIENSVNKRLRGITPRNGNESINDNNYVEKLANARKNNDTFKAIKIKQEAANKGEFLF